MTQVQRSESAAGNGNFITNPDNLAGKILEWQKQGFHVLSPAIQVSTFAQGYGVNASLVLLNHQVDGKGRGLDVYFDGSTMRGDLSKRPQSNDERGLSKIGLGKIASAAGVSWVSPYGRVDPLTILHLWIYQVTGVHLAYDGTPQVMKGEKEIDYRDGSAQIGGWTPQDWRELEARNKETQKQNRDAKLTWNIGGWSENRVKQARCNGAERAETGALERAIRMGFGIKHVYTIEELEKPFVALRVCPLVDMTDPEIRRMVAIGQLQGVAALYAGQTRALPPASMSARDVIDIGSSRRFEPELVERERADSRSGAQQERSTLAPPAEPAEDRSGSGNGNGSQTKRANGSVDGTTALPQPGQMPPAVQDRQAQQPQGQPRTPAPDGAVYLRDVIKQEKIYGQSHRKKGQTYYKWIVIDAAGVEATTVYGKFGDIAEEAYRDGLPVFMETRENEFNGRFELEITAIELAASAKTESRQPAGHGTQAGAGGTQQAQTQTQMKL